MTGNEYQKLAARTINPRLTREGQQSHALLGIGAEAGEILGLWQKLYQGHARDYTHEKKELGDILWMIAEYCTANGWDLEEIMSLNIEKLRAREPQGVSESLSLNRRAGDV